MKKLLLTIFCLYSLSLFAQKREGAVWIVGSYYQMDWNSGQLEVRAVNHHGTGEQSASICSANGDLLFYSTAWGIADRTYRGFLGTSYYYTTPYTGFGAVTDDQIFPLILNDLRGNKNKYLLFNAIDNASQKGLYYHEVDMAGNNGFGSINLSPTLLCSNSMPYLTAMLHQDGNSYWVVTRKNNAREWHSYLVNRLGVNSTPVISVVGPEYPARPTGLNQLVADYIGGLSSSPNSELFVTNRYKWERDSTLVLYHFDRQNGTISKLFTINFPTKISAPAFSSNSKVLYVSEAGKSYFYSTPPFQTNLHGRAIYQVDLSILDSLAVQASVLVVGRSSIFESPTSSVAVDGHIYFAEGSALTMRIKPLDSLDVILYPNALGVGCGYVKGYRSVSAPGIGNSAGFGKGFPFLNKTVFRNTWKLQATPSADTCCQGDTVMLYAYGAEANNFVWDAHPQLLQTTGGAVKALATQPFTAWVTGSNPYSSNRASVSVEVVAKPAQPVLAWTHPDTVRIMNPTPSTHYEWMENGVLVRTNASHKQVALPARRYQVRAKGQAQCWSAWSQQIISSRQPEFDLARLARIYPNPATDVLNVELPDGVHADELIIGNMLGEVLVKAAFGTESNSLNIGRLSPGVYIIYVCKDGILGKPVSFIKR